MCLPRTRTTATARKMSIALERSKKRRHQGGYTLTRGLNAYTWVSFEGQSAAETVSA